VKWFALKYFLLLMKKMIEALLRAYPHIDFLMAQAICKSYESGTLDEILQKADEEKNNLEKEKENERGSDKVSVH
jgi:hypothetical protein